MGWQGLNQWLLCHRGSNNISWTNSPKNLNCWVKAHEWLYYISNNIFYHDNKQSSLFPLDGASNIFYCSTIFFFLSYWYFSNSLLVPWRKVFLLHACVILVCFSLICLISFSFYICLSMACYLASALSCDWTLKLFLVLFK